MTVVVPADLSHTGEDRSAEKQIDRCIAPLVGALNAVGWQTSQSCCGHGKAEGSVMLADGREVLIRG